MELPFFFFFLYQEIDLRKLLTNQYQSSHWITHWFLEVIT